MNLKGFVREGVERHVQITRVLFALPSDPSDRSEHLHCVALAARSDKTSSNSANPARPSAQAVFTWYRGTCLALKASKAPDSVYSSLV